MLDVHWKEGMLLLPQHLQQLRGLALGRAHSAAMGSGVRRFGLRHLDIAVTAESIAVRSIDAVLPDGTIVRAPEESSVPSHAITGELARSGGRLDVWIGVPRAQSGVSVEASDDHPIGRYRVDVVALRDEVNATQDSERQVEVRRLNARLFVGSEDRDGYECLRIARVSRRGDLDPEPIIDPRYIPPVLDVTSHAGLAARLDEVATALREKNRSLGEDVASRPFSFALQTGADPESIFKLSATNAHVARLEQLSRTSGVHPFDVYLELCQLAGSLAIFTPARRAPDLPVYDHEDLETSFDAAIGAAMGMLDASVRRFYELEEFSVPEGGNEPVCRLQPLWLEAGSELYLGVQSVEHAPEDLDRIVGQQIKLFGHGDDASRLAVGGIKLERQVRVPAALPDVEDVFYFRLDREATQTPRWAALANAGAVELVTAGAPIAGATFSLYAVPRRGSES